MGDDNVLLVTGVDNYWGARVAGRLLQEVSSRVIGTGRFDPAEEIPRLDFIAVDSRNPLLAELLRSESVSAVCHLDFKPSTRIDDKMSQRNLSGLMNVLTACADAGVQRVVVKSSTAVYGARPDNSAFLTEESVLQANGSYGYTRDLLEIEAYCNGCQAQWPQIGLTVLRFANIIGAEAVTPMRHYLSLSVPPMLFGFDPILQLVHEDDVVEALAQAMLHDRPGVYNVAAEEAMPLSRILRLARRIPIPILHPLAYRGLKVLDSAGLEPQRYVPLEWDYLRYSLVADLSRMHEDLAFTPAYTAAESLRELSASRRAKRQERSGARHTRDEAWLRDIIDRRQRQRERQASTQVADDAE